MDELDARAVRAQGGDVVREGTHRADDETTGYLVLAECVVRSRVAAVHDRLDEPRVQLGEGAALGLGRVGDVLGSGGHQLPFGYSTRRMWTGSVNASRRT